MVEVHHQGPDCINSIDEKARGIVSWCGVSDAESGGWAMTLN